MSTIEYAGKRPGNRILGALSRSAFALIERDLEAVELRVRARLQETNRHIKHVYFPVSGLATVIAVSGRDRRLAEVGVLGHEGFSGIAAVLGASRAPCEIFMQIEGEGHRIEVEKLNAALEESSEMRHTFLQAIHVFHVQANFNALANAHGKIEERLARWLLMAQDRVPKATLEMTHESFALMLGVRRAGVTVAMHQLETRGMVTAARGSVTILDREGLEGLANGLYGQPEAEFERLFMPSALQH